MTAVEWLVSELKKYDSAGLKDQSNYVIEMPTHILTELEEQAKEMEKQQQENFASWCIKKRVDFFDDTEIGETYTIDGFVSRYKMKELLEMYRNTTHCVV